jgi:hypothetical protein
MSRQIESKISRESVQDSMLVIIAVVMSSNEGIKAHELLKLMLRKGGMREKYGWAS